MARSSRSRVLRLAGTANLAASLAPARPASATLMCRSIARSGELRRPRGTVSSGTCSAKVRFEQAAFRQLNRRTSNKIHTGVAPSGVSASRRRYRSRTDLETTWQAGQTASSVSTLAWI